MNQLPGSSIRRLRAKTGFLDQLRVLVGSMNIDPRSDRINTEIGLAFDNPALADMTIGTFQINELAAMYRVRFATGWPGQRWTAVKADAGDEVLNTDPDTSRWQRLKALLISWLTILRMSKTSSATLLRQVHPHLQQNSARCECLTCVEKTLRPSLGARNLARERMPSERRQSVDNSGTRDFWAAYFEPEQSHATANKYEEPLLRIQE